LNFSVFCLQIIEGVSDSNVIKPVRVWFKFVHSGAFLLCRYRCFGKFKIGAGLEFWVPAIVFSLRATMLEFLDWGTDNSYKE